MKRFKINNPITKTEMLKVNLNIDVLCVGHACFDLIFAVDRHLGPDEKGVASSFKSCGGGPAANAAVTASRLGYKVAFAGYIGNDIYGKKHIKQLEKESVITDLVVRGSSPTPLSAILVKPDGKRTLINYRGSTKRLKIDDIDFSNCNPKAILFDGLEPEISFPLAEFAREHGIPAIMDAGSVHYGTQKLTNLVDYIVASKKFACEFTSETDEEKAVKKLSEYAPSVVVTLGERGLIWKDNRDMGWKPAFTVDAVDTTGAGDAFHGAFAAGIVDGKKWDELLRYSSAVAALCCTKLGARLGIPTSEEVKEFLENTGVKV